MKISLQWLAQYVDFDLDPAALGEIFTHAGFTLEDIQQVGDDWMLDLEVCSNRPDCLGHIGLARELAVVTAQPLKIPSTDFTEQGKPIDQWNSVDNQAPQYCKRYTARIIDAATIAPSPDWMVARLETVGIRAINNVVDITNYVMLETGQPLHAFDYTRLKDGRIVVRLARPGERMEMIDHSSIELNDNMLVIADAANPVALAGVMGGLASEVTDTTSTLLLESAHFDPLSVRRTSRALTLASESSFRFERNVDIVNADWASRRAAALLAELTGGHVAPGVADVWPQPPQPITLQMRLSRLKTIVGIQIDSEFVMNVFTRLGLAPSTDGTDAITCTVPSWRTDVTTEADLIEEVIRIHGYQHIPTEPRIQIEVAPPDPYQRSRAKVAEVLNAGGFFETVNVGFIEDQHAQPFWPDGFSPVRVKDFTRKSNNALRHSLLPALLAARKRNQDAGNNRCDLYELAAVHRPAPDQHLPAETIMLSLSTDGNFQHLRGVIEVLATALDKGAIINCNATPLTWAAPGTGAALEINDRIIGHAGLAGPKVKEVFDLQADVCLAEIDFAELHKLQGRTYQLQPLLRFPPITRDLSLVLKESIPWADIESTIQQQKIEDLRTVEFVHIYRGKGIPHTHKSLTLSMNFRNDEETLTHRQVDQYQQRILDALAQKFDAQLRT